MKSITNLLIDTPENPTDIYLTLLVHVVVRYRATNHLMVFIRC